jgi:hypothetical protein
MRTIFATERLGEAERRYHPQPYAGAIALFYGLGTLDFGPNLGWDGLAESFDHRVIEDGVLDRPRDIMNEPSVGITAKQLAPYLTHNRGAMLPATSLSPN